MAKSTCPTSELRPEGVQTQTKQLDVRCVFLGDGAVGKSSLLITYLGGQFPESVTPGTMDSMAEYSHLAKEPAIMIHQSSRLHMTLMDSFSSGSPVNSEEADMSDEHQRLRPTFCANADVYALCFDISRPSTLERIKHTWIKEFRDYSAPDTPFVVVGLKTDARSKAMVSAESAGSEDCVTFGDALRASEEMGASQYVECSAKGNDGVLKVFRKVAEVAALHSLPPDDLRRSSCVLS